MVGAEAGVKIGDGHAATAAGGKRVWQRVGWRRGFENIGLSDCSFIFRLHRCQHLFPPAAVAACPSPIFTPASAPTIFRERLVREEADLSTALVGELKKF